MWESKFIQRDELWFRGKWQKEKHFLQNQSIKIVYPIKENVFIGPNHERNRDYHENPSLSHLRRTLILRKMEAIKPFLAKPKYQNHVSQWEECVYCASFWRNGYYCGNPSLTNLMEEFLAKPKPQNCIQIRRTCL